MRKIIFRLLFFIALCSSVQAQQLPVLDNYLLNPASISPAFSGKYNVFQAYVTHRSQEPRLDGSPIVGNVNIDGAIGKKMGVGGSLIMNKAGIYKNFSVNLHYAYHLQLAKLHFLSFGISAAMYQNSMDLSSIIIKDPTDPMLINQTNKTESYFNVGASLLYTFRDFNFSIAFPMLFNNRSFYVESPYQNVLTMSRNFLVYSNYTLGLNEDWKLKFDLLYRYVQQVPWTIEVSAVVKFKDSYWLGMLYRKPSVIGVNAGLEIIDCLDINYTYEFLGSSMVGKSGGNHEVTVGYHLGGTAKPKKVLQIKDYAR